MMVAYNFKEKFTDDVKSGKKRQTIRRRRKRPTVAGDTLQLYTGMRTKKCRLLYKTTCRKVADFILFNDICFSIDGIEFNAHNGANGMMLARKDGFNSWEEMVEFFRDCYGLPFRGEIIYWELEKKE